VGYGGGVGGGKVLANEGAWAEAKRRGEIGGIAGNQDPLEPLLHWCYYLLEGSQSG